MNYWYEFTPIDTLFFRGNEPMEAGQPVSAPMFPPPASVVQGALRTTVLKERGIPFSDYKQGKVDSELVAKIGRCGESAPFEITAICIRKNGTLYVPAPVSWYLDLTEKPNSFKGYIGKKIISATTTAEDVNALLISSSSGKPSIVVAEQEAVSLAGCWININLLAKKEIVIAENDLLMESELYSLEDRTGIGLDYHQRAVEKGMLYSAQHIRLHDGVTIVAATDIDPGLSGKGILQLGGEQRRCQYEQIEVKPVSGNEAGIKGFVSLAPVVCEEALLAKLVAASKPMVTAGWDLNRGFHKPTTSWLPAGTVFTEKINQTCISIAI